MLSVEIRKKGDKNRYIRFFPANLFFLEIVSLLASALNGFYTYTNKYITKLPGVI